MLTNLTMRPSPIDYHQTSDNRPIYIPQLDIYTSKPLACGNSKLSKNVLIFDLLAIYTCLNCSACAADCYAVKAQKQYPETWNKRWINTWLAAHDPEALMKMFHEQLSKTSKPLVRIHSSGDFISQEYVTLWTIIAKAHPEKTFYTYTKVDGLFDFKALETLPNVNIVKSLIGGKHRNFGDMTYCQSLIDTYGAHLCPYGVDQHTKPVHCGTDCTICMHHDKVVFLQH